MSDREPQPCGRHDQARWQSDDDSARREHQPSGRQNDYDDDGNVRGVNWSRILGAMAVVLIMALLYAYANNITFPSFTTTTTTPAATAATTTTTSPGATTATTPVGAGSTTPVGAGSTTTTTTNSNSNNISATLETPNIPPASATELAKTNGKDTPTAGSTASPFPGYTFNQGMNNAGRIKQVTSSLSDAIAECSKDALCKAVNTDLWLKPLKGSLSKITEFSKPEQGVYVKNDAPEDTTEVEGYTFYQGKYVPNNNKWNHLQTVSNGGVSAAIAACNGNALCGSVATNGPLRMYTELKDAAEFTGPMEGVYIRDGHDRIQTVLSAMKSTTSSPIATCREPTSPSFETTSRE